MVLSAHVIREIVSSIPEEWLDNGSPFANNEDHRNAYMEFLLSRISQSELFVKEADDARESLV
jgi:hypothetical protein